MEFIEVLILVFSFLSLLAIGVPIAFSIGVASLLTMLVSIAPIPAFTTVSHRMATGLDSFALLAIPFFILAGQLMNSGGIARRLIDFAKVLVGMFPGGLAYVNIMSAMLFGAISGSAVAAASAIGGFMHPRMVKEGYDPDFSAAVNITSSTTGMIIPPSNILIVYSLASGGVSIAALFLAGYLPGILVGLLLMSVAGYFAYKNKYPVDFNVKRAVFFRFLVRALPSIAINSLLLYLFFTTPWTGWLSMKALYFTIFLLLNAGIVTWLYNERELSNSASKNISQIIWLLFGGWFADLKDNRLVPYKESKIFIHAVPSLFLLIVVIGGMVAGLFTATEASAVAVFYTLVLGFAYKEIKTNDLPDILLKTVATTSIVMILIGTSMSMSWVMAYENIPQNVSEALLSFSDNKIVILLIINFILLCVGTFMDMTPAVLIFTPIFLPVVTELGMDPTHFGIVMVLNLCIGLCTPPVGSTLFVGAAVAQRRISTIIRPLLPLFVAMVIALIVVTYVPELSLWLPRAFGF